MPAFIDELKRLVPLQSKMQNLTKDAKMTLKVWCEETLEDAQSRKVVYVWAAKQGEKEYPVSAPSELMRHVKSRMRAFVRIF